MAQADVEVPTLERIVDAVEFPLMFGRAPRQALEPYRGIDDISFDLALLTVGAVGVSVFLVWVFDRLGWRGDPEVTKANTKKIFGRHIARFTATFTQEKLKKAAPVAAMLLIVLATIVVHGFAWTWTLVDERIHLLNAKLGGTVLDSINASLAFSAFYIPVATLCAAIVGGVSRARPEWQSAATEIAGVFVGVVFLVYYPLALSGAHPDTSYTQAFTALAGWFVAILLLGMIWARLQKTAS